MVDNMENEIKFFNAVNDGNIDIVTELYKNGFDITANDNYAIILAVKQENLDMVKWLTIHGVDITIDHNLAFEIATGSRNLSIMNWLYENGADITDGNYKNFKLRTVIGDLEILKWFDMRCNIRARTYETAIKHAKMKYKIAKLNKCIDVANRFEAIIKWLENKLNKELQYE